MKFKPSKKPSQGKVVKAQDIPSQGSTQNQTPIFCLRGLGGKYCLSACETVEKASFADTLHKLSKLTWGQIQSSHRHGVGCEIIDRKSIKHQLPSFITDDVAILAFRFEGMKPMVGHRHGRTFHVLFLDRDFTLYDHG